MLKDTFGRNHDYLRISLTDNCNLRCFYCMPEEDYAFAPAAKLMQPDEIEQLAKIFVENGVRKIRLTGGEPLVRKDAPKIIEKLGNLGIDLHMTTNGVRIHEMLPQIIAAKIKGINVSLDTLQPDKFQKITRRDLYHRVRSNIELLLQHEIPTKINVVVMKGLNENEILDFVALTKNYALEVRFIEFMPFAGNKWTGNQVFTLAEILETVKSKYEFLSIAPEIHDTAKGFLIPGHKGTFAVISTMSSPFCEGCNRLRLTADGKLKNCLFSKSETDLLAALRNGENVLELIQETVTAKAKALGGQFEANGAQSDADNIENRSMITIGG
ncbi:GTP 3',8-cyclase MoaA [Flavobacterium sp.]|uniref:GTP 3',8-cyclase MoaA n=1 Tax=Flavobacterium sp. TaxID=239 RepID=UPI001216B1A3|nr:GTP 3',8-cyclase MoaA [Flavobacterium sp.]RZJ73034.1 MAG: GTP 3',8-cyclase MoaA [Flavobacterium sp.]